MTQNKEIAVLVGPPGSGKSTYAMELKEQGYTRISQDDQGKTGHVFAFDTALNAGENIVIDRMNFDVRQRQGYLNNARRLGYKTRIVVFHVPYKVCIERVMNREGHPTINGIKGLDKLNLGDQPELLHQKMLEQKSDVARSALGTFFSKYERVTNDEADVVERRGWENARGRALVVDIDGTIANIEHRRHYVDKTLGKPNWMKFFDEMHLDTPNQWCVDLVKAIYAMSNNMTPEQNPYTIIFASGRPDNHRKMSEEWLNKALGYGFYQNLYMRRRDDSRQDNIVKEIILEFELKPLYKQMLMVDDRKQVVDMWRQHGYTVLHCDEGNF